MTLEQELSKGMEAQKNYDIVKPRLAVMKEEARRRIEETKPQEMEEREQRYYFLMAVKQLEQSFLTEIQTAKLAKKQLEIENG